MTPILKKNEKLRVLKTEVKAFKKMLKQKYPKEFQECNEYTRLELDLEEFIEYGCWEHEEDDN